MCNLVTLEIALYGPVVSAFERQMSPFQYLSPARSCWEDVVPDRELWCPTGCYGYAQCGILFMCNLVTWLEIALCGLGPL
jgi:hypothetical protein